MRRFIVAVGGPVRFAGVNMLDKPFLKYLPSLF